LEVVFDGGFPVATIRGDRPWDMSEPGSDATDGRCQQRRVGRLADVHAVVQHDTIGVVNHWGRVAELHGSAETSLGDRPGVGVVQRHHPDRTVGHPAAGETHPGLRRHPFHQGGGALELGQDRQEGLREVPRRAASAS
jgi:hypothetical protein